MIKLIASDLDGTLLLNGAESLRPETSGLIQELTRQGRIFAAASCRQYANMCRLFKGVEEEIAYICENGSLVIYQGKILEEGQPRNDRFFHTDRKIIMDKLSKSGVKIDPSKKLILYAPTWKGSKYSSPDTSLDAYFELIHTVEANICKASSDRILPY